MTVDWVAGCAWTEWPDGRGIRNFEIIGEAAHNIERFHTEFAAAHPEIPWTVVYAMRNRVAHGYFKVDLEMVWKTIHTDLPELHTQIQQLLDEIK